MKILNLQNKKTVVVVSATIMLLMIAAIAIIYYKDWSNGLTNDKIVELQGQLDEVELLEFANNTLLIKNYNNLNLNIIEFFIDKDNCPSLSGENIGVGYAKLNISSCSVTFSKGDTYVIGIITDKVTLSKKMIYKESLSQ